MRPFLSSYEGATMQFHLDKITWGLVIKKVIQINIRNPSKVRVSQKTLSDPPIHPIREMICLSQFIFHSSLLVAHPSLSLQASVCQTAHGPGHHLSGMELVRDWHLVLNGPHFLLSSSQHQACQVSPHTYLLCSVKSKEIKRVRNAIPVLVSCYVVTCSCVSSRMKF